MGYTRHFTIRLKKLLAILFITVLLFNVQIACASNVDDSLSVGIQRTKTTEIKPFDPQESDILSIYNLVYESLIRIDDNLQPQPHLCESWEFSGDGKKLTLYIRNKVFFSDGTPLTANDVAATIKYILNRANQKESSSKGYYRNLSYFITSVKSSGDNIVTLSINSARRNYSVLFALNFPIVKATETEISSPLGTGPYYFDRFDPNNNFMLLRANRNWWKQQPQVQTISVNTYATPREVIDAYQHAEVNTIFTRAISASQYTPGSSTLVINYRTNQLETLLMNNNAAYMDDTNVRKAIRYAIDVDKLAAGAYMGMVTRTDTPMVPGTWTYNDNLNSYFAYSPAKAVELLEQSGWYDMDDDTVRDKAKPDGSGNYRLHLRLLVYEEPDNDVRVETATTIANYLNAVGFEVETDTVTMTGMQERLKAGSFDLALVAFQMDQVPDPGFLLMSKNTGDYSRYRNEAMTKIFKDQLRKKLNQSEYQQILMNIQQKFAEDCPFMCLYYRRGVILTRKMFTTYRDIREYELLRGIESFRSR